MNQKQSRKKWRELAYGAFFVDWLNKNYGCNYSTVSNEQEDSDIDVFGISPKKEKLNLQMITSNSETLKLAKQNSKKRATSDKFGVIPVDSDGWVKKAVIDKNQKHYSKPEQLIIVIEGFLPTPKPEEIKKVLIISQNIKFKGIYYVSLPVISSTYLDYEKEGYVVTIKSAFDSI